MSESHESFDEGDAHHPPLRRTNNKKKFDEESPDLSVDLNELEKLHDLKHLEEAIGQIVGRGVVDTENYEHLEVMQKFKFLKDKLFEPEFQEIR